MKIKVLCIILIITSFIIIISKSVIKNSKNGNNISSQEIVDQILNTNSYIAEIEVEVISNKNKNKYIILQEYNTDNGCIQEVVEPSNIAGIKIIKKDNKLRVENTELNLSKIFENYTELESNDLDLCNFINEYKYDNLSNFEEENDNVIMKTKNKLLYINSGIPEKLLIKDNNQNTKIIIKYNKIELK